MTEIETVSRTEVSDNGVVPFDFSHMEIEDATAEFEFPPLSKLMPEPILIVRTATNENAKYNAASLRMSGKRKRKGLGDALSALNARQDRDEDRILYPKYVAVGWSGVVDKSGNHVKFNHDNCKAFIAALPTWLFDRLRIFCMRPEGFLGEDDALEMVEPDPVAVAGN